MSSQVPAGYTLQWGNAGPIMSQAYRCGHCGNQVASAQGWFAFSTYTQKPCAYVVICHFCGRPTFLDDDGRQFPGLAFGDSVSDLPADLQTLYEESRRATGASSYTAAVLCCRKILMHVAVSKGAKPGARFIEYVEYLVEKNFIPPDARSWVDHIRSKSNEANHEIAIMARADAEELLAFTEMLLKFVFEFPAAILKKKAPRPGGAS
jgi:hypothetical protein